MPPWPVGAQEQHSMSGRVYHFPEEVIRRIAYFRSGEKSDPLYYARLTVTKAQADMGRESLEATSMRESEQIDVGRSSLDKSSGTSG